MNNIGGLKYQMMKNIWQYQVKNLIKYQYINSRAKK